MAHHMLGLGDIHRLANWEYATATARNAATGFVAHDIGKIAKQTDNNTFWELTAVTPAWIPIAGANANRSIEVSVIAGIGSAKLVNIQIVDGNGDSVEDEQYIFDCWLSDDNEFGTPTSTIPDTTYAVDTGEEIHAYTGGKMFKVLSELGQVRIELEESTSGTWYLWISWGLGAVVVSDAITFS